MFWVKVVGFALMMCVCAGIRTHLMEESDNQCPKCLEVVYVGSLIPNRYLRKKVFDFDKMSGGNYIKSYEKLYSTPPSSEPPLPPHLRFQVTSKTPDNSKSPCNNTDQISAADRPSSPTTTEKEAPPSEANGRTPASPSPNNEDEMAKSRQASPANIASPPQEDLYRGLLKDVEEHEKEILRKTMSPKTTSQSDGESEKAKKKKKEKKKKHNKEKEKKKDKHKRSHKSPKSPKIVSPGRDQENVPENEMPPSKRRKRSHSSDSNESSVPADTSNVSDGKIDLFNVALNVPYNQNVIAPYPFTGSDALYPAVPDFSVPPPVFGGATQPPSQQPWLTAPTNIVIDDPLAAFNRHLREKDERKRREQMRRNRSPSYGERYPQRWSRSRSPRRVSPRTRRYRYSRTPSPRRYASPPRRPQVSPHHRHYSPDRRPSPPGPHRFASPDRRYQDKRRSLSRSRLVNIFIRKNSYVVHDGRAL